MLGRVRRFTSWVILLPLLLTGCLEDPEPREVYRSLETQRQDRLPVSPHVTKLHARPDRNMVQQSAGMSLNFRVLDKRTLRIHTLDVKVGEPAAAPWLGGMLVHAYVPDLMVYRGRAIHGPDGHINPSVWVELRDAAAEVLYEGWLYARDTALISWDHPRFDLTFVGPTSKATQG
uniref:Lipoprotein n=1 Tax=Magnetococcus massalia (strain MO-1) TaxID=451514 RepID=A0A1S7LHB3_MAGMO|nr:Conserved protein of unknown function [Candidatus Magnetococcus massalia]